VLKALLAILLGALPVGLALLLWRRASRLRHVPRRATFAVLGAGGAVGVLAIHLERLVLGWTGLSLESGAASGGAFGALLSMMLFASPLEEGLKVLVVWPLFSSRRITTPRLGITYAACAGAGFAAAEAAHGAIASDGSSLAIARLLLGMPAHLFFAGVWGYALGSGRRSRGKWFGASWIVATLSHALFDHVVFGRGSGALVVALPMLALMALLSWIALRDVAPRPDAPVSLRFVPEPPSLDAMRRALGRSDRPLMIHWIAIGALVTLGVMLVSLAVAVYAGHRIGIDFALADQEDVRASGPLVLLGSAMLAAFPLAGYLVARASAATSVLEPAMGAGLAIAAVVALLSVTAPIAVAFALAVAPVAFVLACSGAWFGLSR
jgi:RsiW-degrading membrane proteinase PrsW (M82 family)